MSQLHVSLLGEPLVKHGEATLTFSTRKALALLAYLAVEGGLHPRKTLSEAFWPELDAEHGRAALRATLLELRRLFERSHGPGEQDHLRIERDLLGIAQDNSLLVDLRLIEAASKLAGRGIASLVGQARDEILAQLEQASRQVRGPFLAGFSLRDSQFFDDWSSQNREHWHLRASQVFDALSMLYEQGGEVERAIESVTRWLWFDPLNEEGYRRLMRLRFSRGDRVGALGAYARCRTVLAEELQVEPEPETVALAKRIRHTAPLRPAQVRPARASAGRIAEFGTLIERYQHAQAGQPQLVLLQGEGGIGKTRLATEFARWAIAQGADVLMGKALQTERPLPYQPLVEVLRRRLEQEQAPATLVSEVWLAELAHLLPELRERYPDLSVPAPDEVFGHARLFEATARLIRAWAARRPLVLLLDDVQWADPATLDLLLYLARSLAEQPAPVLLLFNLTTSGESFAEAPSSWVMALKRTRLPLTARVLAAFTQEETHRFVRALVWAEQPPAVGNGGSTDEGSGSREVAPYRDVLVPFANWLYVQTQGHPLYLVETLKELLAREILVPSPGENGAWGLVLRAGLLAETPVGELIPSSVRELIRSQLGRLTPSARALLVAGAALGQGLSFERLIGVAQLDEREGLRALEELLRNGWLCEGAQIEEGQGLDDYAFPREMMREVVYQEAGVTHQRLIQRRVLAVRREEAGDNLGEEAPSRPPQPTPADGHVLAEPGNGQGRRIVAGAASRGIRGMHLAVAKDSSSAAWRHAGTDENTPLAAWERSAAGHAAPALPRSPPGRPGRAVFETR
jgi:DNA-binding SARP family transcriptional activator